MTNEGHGTKARLLEIHNVSKSFPGVKAFSNISFDLFAGEVHCIVGENGAGKSTFIKILSGALRPDEGRITICGTELGFVTPSMAQHLGIQTIYQETTLVPSLSIAENMFLGSEVTGKLTFVNFAYAARKDPGAARLARGRYRSEGVGRKPGNRRSGKSCKSPKR